jgi:hypothetical protein
MTIYNIVITYAWGWNIYLIAPYVILVLPILPNKAETGLEKDNSLGISPRYAVPEY